MKSLLFIFAIFVCLHTELIGQNTITVKLQVMHARQGIQKRLRVVVNNQLFATNDSGFLRLTLPRNSSSFKISLLQSNYLLLFPPGGNVFIPRDVKEVPVIIIGEVTDHLQVRNYISLLGRKGNASIQSDSLNKEVDSLRSVLLKMKIPEEMIRKLENAAVERNKYFEELLTDILGFRNSLTEFKNVYKFQSAAAFEEPGALEALISSANRYNGYYRKFERQHAAYEMQDPYYLNQTALSREIRAYADFLVNKVHAAAIFPIQEAVLQIRQYHSSKKKNKSLRRSIEIDAGKFIASIEKILPELDRQTNRLLLQLIEN